MELGEIQVKYWHSCHEIAKKHGLNPWDLVRISTPLVPSIGTLVDHPNLYNCYKEGYTINFALTVIDKTPIFKGDTVYINFRDQEGIPTYQKAVAFTYRPLDNKLTCKVNGVTNYIPLQHVCLPLVYKDDIPIFRGSTVYLRRGSALTVKEYKNKELLCEYSDFKDEEWIHLDFIYLTNSNCTGSTYNSLPTPVETCILYATYYVADPAHPSYFRTIEYGAFDIHLLERGLIFRTVDEAIAAAKHMLQDDKHN